MLVSGGVSGTINEILKHNVDEIDYVELDPLLIKLGKKYTSDLDSEKLNIINKDGRLHVKSSDKKYDLIILDLPDPTTAQINRFYTLEFFKETKCILTEKGILSLSLSSSENYLNIEEKKLHSSIYNTLNQVYNNTIIIPGEETFYISSDEKLNYNISEKLNKKNISTKYVNQFYLKSKLTQERINYFLDSLDKNVHLNKDFNPISYYYNFLKWSSMLNQNYVLIGIFFLIIILYFILKLNPFTFSLFTTGFSSSSLELLLIFSFQALYGYVYNQVGIIITFFMIGLATGSFIINTYFNKISKKSLI